MTSSGTIAPEFAPLVQGSSNQILNYQGQNPLVGYGNSNPAPVAGISPLQQEGMGATSALFNNPWTDALALQSILRLPGAAGAGPTTGSENLAGLPSLAALFGSINPGYSGFDQAVPAAPTFNTAGTVENLVPGPEESVPGGSSNPGGGSPTNDQNDGGNPSENRHTNTGQPSESGNPSENRNTGTLTLNPRASQGDASLLFGPSMGATSSVVGGPRPGGSMGDRDFSADYLRRTYGHDARNWDPSQMGSGQLFATDENGFPIGPGGIAYTGANHEWGGNPALRKAFQDAGMTGDDYARWLTQGYQARQSLTSSPRAQARVAAGQDIFGNDISHIPRSTVLRDRNGHAINAQGQRIDGQGNVVQTGAR